MGHIGESLKHYREEKGLTQPQMAENLNIGYRTYQSIEANGKIAKAEDLQNIKSLLGDNTQEFAEYDTSDLSKLLVFLIKEQTGLMREQKKLMAQQNSILERQATKVEKKIDQISSSLAVLSERRDDFEYQVRGSIVRDAQRFAKDDPKKLDLELRKIDKLADVYRKAIEKKGIPAG